MLQEVFICSAAADRTIANALAESISVLDALSVCIEECAPGDLVEAAAQAGDAAGIVLVLSSESVPAQSTRSSWGSVLDRIERAPSSVASVLLDDTCPFPPSLRTRALFTGVADAPPALRRWAVALDTSVERFEVVGVPDQFEFRDVIWVPCAGRDSVSVDEDFQHALDGRRVLILLDGCSQRCPPTTREVLRAAEPVPHAGESLAHEVPAIVATCYQDFLHRDFCARLANVEPSALTACLSPVTRDGRILRVPTDLRRTLAADAAPRRRHAELLQEYLAAPNAREHLTLIRLELPAALAFAFATDWNFAAGLTWRACQLMKDSYSREAAQLLLKLRDSAIDKSVRSWVELCERELHWLGVTPPASLVPERRGKADKRQMTLDW